jgi:hypothetical protein
MQTNKNGQISIKVINFAIIGRKICNFWIQKLKKTRKLHNFYYQKQKKPANFAKFLVQKCKIHNFLV